MCLFVCIRRAIWNPECSFPIIIRIAFLVSRTLLLYSSETACKGALSRLLWIQYSPPVPRVVTVAFRRREKNNNRDAVAVIVDPPKAGVMIRLAKKGKELEVNAFFCSHGRPAMTSSFNDWRADHEALLKGQWLKWRTIGYERNPGSISFVSYPLTYGIWHFHLPDTFLW